MIKFLNIFAAICLSIAGVLAILQGNAINGLLMIALAKQCEMSNQIENLKENL